MKWFGATTLSLIRSFYIVDKISSEKEVFKILKASIKSYDRFTGFVDFYTITMRHNFIAAFIIFQC